MNDSLKSIVDISRTKYSANTFQATESHRKAKTAFWSHFFSSGEVAPSQIDPATAARISGYNQVLDWWPTEGFKEWFSNGEEFRQRVEHASNLALDVIHALLTDDQANPGIKLQAAKMALEIASKFPKVQPKEQFIDAEIGKMGRKELEDFINSKLVRLPSTPDLPKE